jgi:hypothetical protein
VTCSEVEEGNFTKLVLSFLLNVGKSVLKMTGTLWKNSLIDAKDVRMNHIKFTVIAITFSAKRN